MVIDPPGDNYKTLGFGASSAWWWGRFRQVMSIDQWALRHLALGSMCPPPGSLEAHCA